MSAAFRDAALIREEAFISMWILKRATLIRGRRLFGARRLLEEIQYWLRLGFMIKSFNTMKFVNVSLYLFFW